MDRGDRRKSIFSLLTFFSSPQASSVLCKYTTSSLRDKISSTIFPAPRLRERSRDALSRHSVSCLVPISCFATRISPSDFCRNISYREVTIYKVSSSTTDFFPKYLLFSQKYRTFALSLPSVGNLQRSRALNQLISVLYFSMMSTWGSA